MITISQRTSSSVHLRNKLFVFGFIWFPSTGPVSCISAFIQVKTWRRISDKSLLERIMAQFRKLYATPDINELMVKIMRFFRC